MKVLITGGAGFLGTNIVLKCRERGWTPIVLDNFVRRGSDRNAAILDKRNVTIIHGETRLREDWDQLPAVDAVIHLAGQPGIPKSLENPVLDFHVNSLGTLYALEYARRLGIPLLYASTNKIYSDAVNTLPTVERETRYEVIGQYEQGIPETFPMDSAGEHPHSPYGVSKAAADLLCQEYFHAFGVPTVVFRMSCIYGLYQNGVSEQGWTDWFIRQRILGDNSLTIFGDGKQVRDCLFGSDAAEAYCMALEKIDKVAGKVFNLGGGKFNTSLIEWIDILNTTVDLPKMELTYGPWRLADHKVYISDTTKVERELGWKATVSVPEGIAAMIAAYKGDTYAS